VIRRESNLLRSLINEHVRRAVADGKLAGRVLNISAGSIDYRELIESQAGARLIATDWLRAQTKVAVNVFCDAGALPFYSGSFSAVLCTEVLEHLPKPARTLSEAFRVLAPGGYLVLTTPFMYHAHQRPYDFFRYTAAGLQVLLGEAGFVDIQIRRSGDSLAVLLHSLKMQRWRGTTSILRWMESAYLRTRGDRAVNADVGSDPMALGYCATARSPE
jgi:SAM-dependent methyltransferase